MNQVRLLSQDDTLGAVHDVTDPSWAEVEKALERLDGKRWTQVGMVIAEERHMIVGGGPDGYVLSCQRGETLFSLRAPERGGRGMRSVVCGQRAEFPEDEVVAWDAVLAATAAYYHSAALAPNLQWREY